METSTTPLTPWWKGRRGEWFVVGQVALFALVAFGPRTASWMPEWPGSARRASSILGVVLMIAGFVWVVAGAAHLGRSLSPLPHPKDGATLIDTGAFAFVRHPMYCGGIWMAVGWALFAHSLLTLAYGVLLAVFLDRKASREEKWLAARFPGYPRYQARVRKLMPFVY